MATVSSTARLKTRRLSKRVIHFILYTEDSVTVGRTGGSYSLQQEGGDKGTGELVIGVAQNYCCREKIKEL